MWSMLIGCVFLVGMGEYWLAFGFFALWTIVWTIEAPARRAMQDWQRQHAAEWRENKRLIRDYRRRDRAQYQALRCAIVREVPWGWWVVGSLALLLPLWWTTPVVIFPALAGLMAFLWRTRAQRPRLMALVARERGGHQAPAGSLDAGDC